MKHTENARRYLEMRLCRNLYFGYAEMIDQLEMRLCQKVLKNEIVVELTE